MPSDHLRRVHLAVGIAALVAFVLTGQYMDRVHAHLDGMADAPRMLFRSAHIYLLFAALLNLLLGVYLRPAHAALGRALQLAGSAALLATPAMFTAAFFAEPWLPELLRPWARPAIYLSLAGALAHVAGAMGAPRLAPGAPRAPTSASTTSTDT